MSYDNLRPNEIDTMRFAFQVYQCDKDKLDSTELGRLIRAMNLNPSLDRLSQLGVAKKVGEKFFNAEECLTIYGTLKKEIKDMGCYEDFIECLKLYDKAENGHMMLGELSSSLLALGEKLTDAEVDELFEDCMGEENDEGEIEYIPFLAAMCDVKKPAA